MSGFFSARPALTKACADDRGGVAVIFGGALLLICAFIGAAIDFARYRSTADAMQQIADAAVLAATAEFNKTGDLNAATRKAQAYLDATAQRLSGVDAMRASTTVDASENVRVRILGTMQTTFLALAGMRSLRLASTAEAAVNDPHMDLHVLIDTTGSMNIPDTPADIARFGALFRPYGGLANCSFACHGSAADELYNGRTGLQIARENGIYLREDRIRDSVVQMIDLLATSSTARGLRISPYTFSWNETQLLPLSNNFDEVRDVVSRLTGASAG